MNTKIYILSSLILVVCFMSSCTNQAYQSPSYEDKAASHKTIAVLPYELIYDGRIPAKLSAEEIEEIELNESLMFQASLYNQILNQASRQRKSLQVDIQHFNDTNARLRKAGIYIKESWSMTSSELAAILNVDAVIKSKVHKRRFLTDVESAAVNIGRDILNDIVRRPVVSTTLVRTADVQVSCSVVDAADEIVIWLMARNVSTNYNQSPEQAVDQINAQISRRFPYKKVT